MFCIIYTTVKISQKNTLMFCIQFLQKKELSIFLSKIAMLFRSYSITK